jgi:hypothetical protein
MFDKMYILYTLSGKSDEITIIFKIIVSNILFR